MKDNRITIDNMQDAIAKRQYEAIVCWNRLEARPRKEDFDRALKAEIRDPLWMLTRQWQMDEFNGDDAGSPISAKIHIATTRLNKYTPANHPTRAFNNDVPLEATVEQRPVPYEHLEEEISLNLRVVLGRHWIKMLKKKIGDQTQFFIDQGYSVTAPSSATDKDEANILAHPEGWQKFAAASGRKIDGYAIYKAIKSGVNIGKESPNEAEINEMAAKFVSWVEGYIIQPLNPEENAWKPSQLEYQFSCSAPKKGTEKLYEAEEYYSGKLDWFNFSLANQVKIKDDFPGDTKPTDIIKNKLEQTVTNSLMPTNIDFGGMPNMRWWTFEERKTYIGDIKPNTTDIGKLLFSEFTLLYANDWFLIPVTLKAGTISNVEGLVVSNVFGERTWIDPTGKGKDDDWQQRWTMYTINRKGQDASKADNSLLLLPTVPKIQEGPAIEKFIMVRDEIANMVWAIEKEISLPSGKRYQGSEAASELKAFYKRLLPSIPETPGSDEEIADIRYQIMNAVPENWIPFIPVHLENDNREIQLQRASMPRVIEGDPEPPVKIKPRTTLLCEGLDKTPKQAYYIHEEEVPRSGIEVSLSHQRTRWYGGKVFNWLGIRKKTGRGDGSSGLAFDKIIPTGGK